MSAAPSAQVRPVVFLGPSLPEYEARTILDADYRPPIRRGDLSGIAAGTVVAIIDGVFEQDLAVSPREIGQALARDVVIFGGASMGALRAAEVPGVHGVGQIYTWYRDGVINRDDEVALLFDPETYDALTVPTANVRFAVERLTRPGTIDGDVAARLLRAAADLPYQRRTYRAIAQQAGLDHRADVDDLIAMLEAHNLKRTDAQEVLEAVERRQWPDRDSASADGGPASSGHDAAVDVPTATGPHASLIWESGDLVTHADLLTFLCFTGKLESVARAALVNADNIGVAEPDIEPDAPQANLDQAANRWGWVSTEEAQVTLADLGIDMMTLDRHCVGAARLHARVATSLRSGSQLAPEALIAELLLSDLTLKREVMRLASLRQLAAQHPTDPEPDDLRAAAAVVCRSNRVLDLHSARAAWAELGWSSTTQQDDYLQLVARSRARVRTLRHEWDCTAVRPPVLDLPATLTSAPKPPGERRFCTEPEVAAEHARRLGDLIGVTRVGLIGELADLQGIQVSQAARPGGAWSSSYGSGKSTSRAGAVAGAILEELEKWAQEQFAPSEPELRSVAYNEVRADERFVDPSSLDLPYDSAYSDQAPLRWAQCVDLLTGQPAFLPLDVVRMRRGQHDICYTSRGHRKHLATNGLGSGFSLVEAVLHATCEYVERHAQRMAEIRLVNPGVVGPTHYRFVEPDSGSERVRDVAARLSRCTDLVRVLDITSEVAVPTCMTVLLRDRHRADGYGAHPDPDVAVEMAMLEAAQTLASAAAGGREDLSIRSRSLGRHERPRPTSAEDAWFWLDPDIEPVALAAVPGFVGTDVRDDLLWALGQIQRAGVSRVLIVDLTTETMAPAHVVRVFIPGMETNNPFFTGVRARLALLPDLLPSRALSREHLPAARTEG